MSKEVNIRNMKFMNTNLKNVKSSDLIDSMRRKIQKHCDASIMNQPIVEIILIY